MYVLVQHDISQPAGFWALADSLQPPPNVNLHHTFAVADGTRATCVWEADTVDAVRDFLDELTKGMARNTYYQVPNREGVVFPSMAAAGARR